MITFTSTDDLKREAITRIKGRMENDPSIDEDTLSMDVENAINEIETIRNYPSDYTNDMIITDMSRFFNQIIDVAMFDYNQIGIEGETSHSENGISRTYRSRNSLFRGICPLAAIF